MSRTPQEAVSLWSHAASKAALNYGREAPVEDQYDRVRESYAHGNTTFEELGRRVDELLARGL